MINESEIRERLAGYLAGDLSRPDFEDWLVQSSWNMHLDSSQSAQDLVSEIELRLFEYSSGHLSEEQLRTDLRSYVEHYEFVACYGMALASAARVRVKRPVRRWSNSEIVRLRRLAFV